MSDLCRVKFNYFDQIYNKFMLVYEIKYICCNEYNQDRTEFYWNSLIQMNIFYQ